VTLTRFAPSPTGLLHLGNLRAAVFNWAIARQRGGRFLLRIDDTDSARSEERFVEAIREDLRWLGLDWDEEARQSARLDRYAAAAEALKAAGRLYPCWETPEELEFRRRVQRGQGKPPVYDRAALRLTEEEKAALAAERAPHWRFRLSPEPILWTDGIEGEKRIDPSAVSDPVLIREDGQVLYTLASAVDDGEMGVTDVVRGADHVTNTAAQIQLMEALGHRPPRFAHHSLVGDTEGKPFSKRDGTASLAGLRAAGLEPMAAVSTAVRLGSADDVEGFASPAEAAQAFDLSRFGRAPVKLDPARMWSLSAQMLRGRPFEAVAEALAAMGIEGARAEALWTAVAPNVERLEEVGEWDRLLREGAEAAPEVEDAAFVAEALAALPPRPWGPETWGEWTGALKAATGRKGRALFQPLRRALTGRDRGPEMAALMPLMEAEPRSAPPA